MYAKASWMRANDYNFEVKLALALVAISAVVGTIAFVALLSVIWMEIRRYFGNLHQVSPAAPPAVILAFGNDDEMRDDNQRHERHDLVGEAVRDPTQ